MCARDVETLNTNKPFQVNRLDFDDVEIVDGIRRLSSTERTRN